MGRYLAAAAVLVADTALLVVTYRVPGHGAAAVLVVAACAVLVLGSYHAGRALASRADLAFVVGAASVGLAVQLMLAPAGGSQLVATYLVFVVLPLLVGRYLAQHRALVAALDAHNRQLRTERALLAEREQLRERLRIARDVHDSLGRRLSLVSVRAAALEVSGLPPHHHDAVTALADSARDAMTELYQLVGSLRGAEETEPGVARIDALVASFAAAGVDVTVEEDGHRRPLPRAADHAAYRVVEEGLTNAAKHAAHRPVAIQLTWEPDALVLTVTNPTEGSPATDGGYGLAGLRERVGAAAGFLDHRDAGGEFRLVAMLPTKSPDLAPVSRGSRFRTAALGVATAGLLLVLLPATLLTGVS